MIEKAIFVDIDCFENIPDDTIYTAGSVAKDIGVENIAVVKYVSEKDQQHIERYLYDFKQFKTLLFLNFNDFKLRVFHVQYIFDLLRKLSSNPNIIIVGNGIHVTLATDLFAKSNYFDYLVSGWPWNTPLDYANVTKQTETKRVVSEKCDALPEDQLSLETAFERLINPESCRFNDSHGQYFGHVANKMCDNSCFFCYSHKYKKYGGFLEKSPSFYFNELAFIQEKTGLNRLFVDGEKYQDDTLIQLRNNKFGFADFCGHLCIKDLSKSSLEILRNGGSECIFAAIESLRPDVIKKMRKNFTPEHLSEMLDYAKHLGFIVETNIVLGLKVITGDPLTKTELLTEVEDFSGFWRNWPHLRIYAQPYMPFIGTPLGDKLWNNTGILNTLDIESYLLLLSLTMHGLDIPDHLPVPPCYADREVYNLVTKIYQASVAVSDLKLSYYLYPSQQQSKNDFCQMLIGHCHDMLERGYYDFTRFLRETLISISQWK